MPSPVVSFILATHNRRDITLNTLRKIEECGLDQSRFEVFVVDNASTDGTPDAIRSNYPDVHLMALDTNHGSCAKSFAVESTRGRYIMFLDDDSYPQAGCVDLMIEKFEADDRLGCAGFVVHLPNGQQECSALPNVFIGCGAGFRRDALLEVGGLDATLFMQAEEYDLSFRLINAGYRVETFDDLHVDHLKTPQARLSARTTFHDTRNNLLLVHRYLPDEMRRVYLDDWTRRYRCLAMMHGHRVSFVQGRRAGNLRGRRERDDYRKHRLSDTSFETLFRHKEITIEMTALFNRGVRSIVLADLGKNIYPFVAAAKKTSITVLAIADDRFSSVANAYRDIPLIDTDNVCRFNPDAVVVSNTSPVHAASTAKRWSDSPYPVHAWFAADSQSESSQFASTCPAIPADTSA